MCLKSSENLSDNLVFFGAPIDFDACRWSCLHLFSFEKTFLRYCTDELGRTGIEVIKWKARGSRTFAGRMWSGGARVQATEVQ